MRKNKPECPSGSRLEFLLAVVSIAKQNNAMRHIASKTELGTFRIKKELHKEI